MKAILEGIAPYRKAIVPAVIAGILMVLNEFGITEFMTVQEVVTLIVTAFFVWLIPNKQ